MSWNNIGSPSGTATSALSLDNNELQVTVASAQAGQAAKATASAYFAVLNEAQTAEQGENSLAVESAINGRQLRIYGTIPADEAAWRDRVGIDDPAQLTAWTLRRMLLERGVRVDGVVRVRHRPVTLADDPKHRAGQAVAILQEPPFVAALPATALATDVRAVNKISQNLYAELLLRRIGRVQGSGSLADGIAAVQGVLQAAGLPRTGYDFSDGSGMSTYNRISPRATVQLLRWASTQPWGAAWRESLPVGGVDGTLRKRFTGALKGRVLAKTGTLNATNALSGHLIAASGRELTFSIIANDVPEGNSAVPVMDRVLEVIAAAE